MIRPRLNDIPSRQIFVSLFLLKTFMNNNVIFIDKNIRLKFSKPIPVVITIFASREVRNKLNTNDKLIFPTKRILSDVLRILSMAYPGRKLQTRMEGMSLNHDHRWMSPQFEAIVTCLGLISSISIDRRWSAIYRLSDELCLMFILQYGLCLAVVKMFIIKTSNDIRIETMSFESRASMFQKKARATKETRRYERTADLLDIKVVSLVVSLSFQVMAVPAIASRLRQG